MQITRDGVHQGLRDFVAAGSGVVVGPPGVGKTFLLRDYCSRLLDDHGLCLYLPLDKLIGLSEEAIKIELGIQTDLPTYLASQRSKAASPPVVVIDAFDSARSEFAQQFVLGLIRRLQEKLKSRWRLVVSVRSYDARRSVALQNLFPQSDQSADGPFQDPSIECRHFFVPPLSTDEIEATVASIEGLTPIYAAASAEFRALMAIPFNLWLAESLLSSQGTAAALTAINSEVQLLTLYWAHRVERATDTHERTNILRLITSTMVQQRTLSVRVADVYPSGANASWENLLSADILEEDTQPHRQRVSFAHNILFDYAVSVLLIEDIPEAAARFLSEDPSRPLFLRPSVDYFFTRLWEAAPTTFWAVLWHMLEAPEAHVRVYARLVPTMVMAREARHPDQLAPLMDRLRAGDAIAATALLNLLQTVRGVFSGHRDALWAAVGLQAASHLQSLFAWELAALTSDILKRVDANDGQTPIVAATGAIGRGLLTWALRARTEAPSQYADNVGALMAVPIVLRTIGTDLASSRTLLQTVLETVNTPNASIQYLSRLTNDLQFVFTTDPSFAIDVYEVTFSHEEHSNEKTSFGTPILPLTSTRRQDFSMCQYHLTKDFAVFLQRNLQAATVASVRAVNAHVIARQVLRFLNPGTTVNDVTESFRFRGRPALYVRDLSYRWDASLHRDEPLKLADRLFERLARACEQGELDVLESSLDLFASEVKVAFWWKRLLEFASRYPDTMAGRLAELASALPILQNAETLHAVGLFIETSFVHLDPQQRELIETAILQASAAAATDEEQRPAADARRDRLIARIPPGLLHTPEGLQARLNLEQRRELPTNEPLVRYSSSSRAFTRDVWLEEQGIDSSRDDHKRVLDATAPLDEFSTRWRNGRPDGEAIATIMTPLREAAAVVQREATVDKAIEDIGWERLTAAAHTVARGDIEPGGDEFLVSKQILLQGLDIDSQDDIDDERDNEYTSASWSPRPLTAAAEGLPWLARLGRDDEILDRIATLAQHPEPSVRYLVVRETFRFFLSATDVFWRLLEERARLERNIVVQDSLCRVLGDVIAKEEQRATSILALVAPRIIERNQDCEALNTLVSIIMWLTLERDSEWGRQSSDAFLSQPLSHSYALRQAVFQVVHNLTPSGIGSKKEQRQVRSVGWLLRAIESAAGALRRVEREAAGVFDEARADLYRRLYDVDHEIVMRLQFAFRPRTEDVTDAQRAAFYWRVKPLFEAILGSISDPTVSGTLFAPTAHHFMEFLQDALEHDPPGVLHLAAVAATASEGGGYHLDSMAAAETVKLAERIVTDYRSELRQPDTLSDLVKLLDLFARVGWPDALRLLWRLDEVFR